MLLSPRWRVLCQKLRDASPRRGQRRPRLPFRNKLAIRNQLREFLGDRVRVGLVVSRQHEGRRADRAAELAVDAVDKIGCVEIPAERVEYRLSRLRVVLERFRPAVEAGRPARRHRTDASDWLRQYGRLNALGVM